MTQHYKDQHPIKPSLLYLSVFLLGLLGASAALAQVRITGIMQGTLAEGYPLAIELYVEGSHDLSIYELQLAPDGRGAGEFEEAGNRQGLSGIYTDEFVYIIGYRVGQTPQDGLDAFTQVFGEQGDFGENRITSPLLRPDGNDAFRIVEIDTDPILVLDQVWDENDANFVYRNGFCYRNNGTGPDGSWQDANWFKENEVLTDKTAEEIKQLVRFGAYAPVAAPTPFVRLRGLDPGAGNFTQGSTGNVLYRLELKGFNESLILNSLRIGVRSERNLLSDIVERFTLIRSGDQELGGADDVALGTVETIEAANSQFVTFTGFTQDNTFPPLLTSYLFISVDLLPTAIRGSSIQAAASQVALAFDEITTESVREYQSANLHFIETDLFSSRSDVTALADSESKGISSVINTPADEIISTDNALSTQVWQFRIRDGGGEADPDALATIVNELKIIKSTRNEVDNWQAAIEGLVLFEGDTRIAAATISEDEISFNTPLTIPDDGERTFSLRMTLKAEALGVGNDDGGRFGFRISRLPITTDASGSSFRVFEALSSVEEAEDNALEVVATEFSFLQQPPLRTGVGEIMQPSVSLLALDANGNLDLDFQEEVELISSGSLLGPVIAQAQNGMVNYIEIIHDTTGVNLFFTASFPGINPQVSDLFNIVEITTLYPGDMAIIGFDANIGDGKDRFFLMTMVDLYPLTTFVLTNAYYERSGETIARSNQWETIGSLEFEVKDDTLAQGSIIRIEVPDNGNAPPDLEDVAYTIITDKFNPRLEIAYTGAAEAGNVNFKVDLDPTNTEENFTEQLFIMQGRWPNANPANIRFDGRIIHGLTNGAAWRPFTEDNPIEEQRSRLHPDIACLNVEILDLQEAFYYVPDNVNSTKVQRDMLLDISEVTNWQTGNLPIYLDPAFIKPFKIREVSERGAWIGNEDGLDQTGSWFDCHFWESLYLPDSSMRVALDGEDNCLIPVKPDSVIREAACLDLFVKSGTLAMSTDAAELSVFGNFETKNDDFIPGTGTVFFRGETDQSIDSEDTFHALEIDKPTGNLLLNAPIQVKESGKVTLSSGDLDLNGHDLTLLPGASIQEVRLEETNHLVLDNSVLPNGGPGTIIAPDRKYNDNPASQEALDIDGLGIGLLSSTGEVAVDIVRGHQRPAIPGQISIKKYFDITALSGTVANTTLTFFYANDDIPLTPGSSEPPGGLDLARLADTPGAQWETDLEADYTPLANELVMNNVQSFSTWTATLPGRALPLRLLSFEGQRWEEHQALLTWRTQTEQNTLGFSIEKSLDAQHYQAIGYVDAGGNSFLERAYRFIDQDFREPAYYRLQMQDQDGSFTYSPAVFVNTSALGQLEVYPNPAVAHIQLRFSGESPNAIFQAALKNLNGETILRLSGDLSQIQASMNTRIPGLASGIYLLELTNAEQHQVLRLSKH